jgi:hypothetical protein
MVIEFIYEYNFMENNLLLSEYLVTKPNYINLHFQNLLNYLKKIILYLLIPEINKFS